GKPAPSIAGIKEAALVADWSRRRARGERVSREPPTLDNPQVMMAEQRPATQTAPATAASIPTPAATARAQETAAAPAASNEATEAAPAEVAAEATPAKPGLRNRLLGMFSN